jgi:hypothetical protein
MLILLPLTYVGIIYIFNHDVSINKPKVVEESLKILAAYVFAIASLGISQLNEKIKFERRAKALRNILAARLTTEANLIETLVSTAFPLTNGDNFEELRVNNQFFKELRGQLDSLIVIINEAQQLLLKSDPESIALCQDYSKILQEASLSLITYSRQPSRNEFEKLQQALRGLINLCESKQTRT